MRQEPFQKNFAAAEFGVLPELAANVVTNGAIEVPTGYCGYVIYGPYWTLSPGLHVVEVDIEGDDSNSLGTVELFDSGDILAEAPLRVGGVLAAHLKAVKALEVRVRSAGRPFQLKGLRFTFVPVAESRKIGPGELARALHRLEAADRWLASGSGGAFAEPKLHLVKAMHAHENLWRALQSGASPATVRQLQAIAVAAGGNESWRKDRAPARVLDAWGERARANAEEFLRLGVDPAFLRLAANSVDPWVIETSASSGQVSQSRDRFPSLATDAPSASPWLRHLSEVQGHVNISAAALGAITSTCPFTGALLESRHGLPIAPLGQKQVYIFYRFVSLYPFYVITGGFSGGKMFIYLPLHDTFIRLHPPTLEWGSPLIAEAAFLDACVQKASEISEYFTKPTMRAALSGTLDNMGHFFWNEVCGVIEFERAGLMKDTRRALLYRHDYIDPFELLEEEGDILVTNLRTPEQILDSVLCERLFPYRPVAAQVSDAAAERLRRLAIKRSTPAERAALSAAKAHGHILWVGLRAHNKVWLNQVDGLRAIVQEARTRGPLTVFADGTLDCSEVLSQLRASLTDDVRVHPGIDVSIYDSMLWAFGSDAYVATIGSGLVLPTWIAKKPGVAHSETHHLPQMAFWPDVRPGAPPPLTPRTDDILDCGSSGYCNYTILPEVMADLFRAVAFAPRLEEGSS